jgi:hypothetical protein
MTATTDDLRELELDFAGADAADTTALEATPAQPELPAYLSSAARRRALDAQAGTGAFRGLAITAVAGLVISMGVFGIVAVQSAHNAPVRTSVSTTP